MPPPPPPPPPPPAVALMEELVEEILLRFPPGDPARLVHAALVCKTWCAIVSGAGFRRRFREFHRTPPLLGFVANLRTQGDRLSAEFVPTTALPARQPHIRSGRARVRVDGVVDAHHGRVLLEKNSVLMVWDPTTDEQEEVPFPPVPRDSFNWTAAVLCAAGGPCDHLDCRRGHFVIVFVGNEQGLAICTYSSSTASWSKPIYSNQLPYRSFYFFTHVAHVGSALYFGVEFTEHILKFDLESQEVSRIQIPTTCPSGWPYVLSTTEAGRLGLAIIHKSSKLYMWSRDDVSQGDAIWTQNRIIDLKALLPVHAVLASPTLLGFSVCTGVIFVMSNNVLFAIDLKTYKVIKNKEVSRSTMILSIVPYMSFYTPDAFRAVSTGEGSRACA